MDLTHFVLNITGALFLGILIGLERQHRHHPAGLRTNALVCLGAALFASLSLVLDHDSSPTRIAGQIVTGIGFLGGGVIIREGFNVRGMNTAATLWCTAAVGTLAGTGFLVHGAIGTVAVLVVHLGLRPIVERMDARAKSTGEVETLYQLRCICNEENAGTIRTILMRHINSQPNMTLHGLLTQDTDQHLKTVVVADIFSTERNDKYLNETVSRLSIEPSVSSVRWERVQ
jgi:putative Mg2+ transporter-C (MgtC) family protein